MNTTSKRISTHCVRTPQLLLQYKITAKISIVLWHVSSYNILLETPRFACRKYKIRKFFKDYYITFAYVLFYLPTYLVDECEFLCVKVIIFIISYMNNLWPCPVAIPGLHFMEFIYFQTNELANQFKIRTKPFFL